MDLLEEFSIDCPYCGEPLVILVDTSVTEQDYIEDCQVCCKPMVIRIGLSADGAVRVAARHEDEA